MQAPPPPMMRGPDSGLYRLIAIGGIVLGLLLLAVGAVLADMSNADFDPNEPEADTRARNNLGLVWGPAIAPLGAFLFVGGLFLAAFFVEFADAFVRLFLLILGVLALLLVLANSPTLFG